MGVTSLRCIFSVCCVRLLSSHAGATNAATTRGTNPHPPPLALPAPTSTTGTRKRGALPYRHHYYRTRRTLPPRQRHLPAFLTLAAPTPDTRASGTTRTNKPHATTSIRPNARHHHQYPHHHTTPLPTRSTTTSTYTRHHGAAPLLLCLRTYSYKPTPEPAKATPATGERLGEPPPLSGANF